jgi:hypothetical protein
MTRTVRKEFYGELSKLFVDTTKLVFAGVIIAGILKEDVNITYLLVGGLITVFFSLYGAYMFFRLSKK